MDKEIVREYLRTAEEKLESARILFEHGQYDDAVSRAYYAAFHAAQALLVNEGLKAETHTGVRQMFGLHFVKTKKIDRRFAKYLKNLKDDREDGDYGILTTIESDDAKIALSEANDFVFEAKRLLGLTN